MNKNLLVSVHGYAGDREQIDILLPLFEHHQSPIVIVSPEDSPIVGVGPHICRFAGKRAYIGQDSWDRQHLQLKLLLEYPQEWFLMNDSDSFVVTPKLPNYLFMDRNAVYSNEVTDFRIPGQTSHGQTWADDYHRGFPLIAMQPPYFCHRQALEKIVNASANMKACPVTPFIDWWFVPACTYGKVKHVPFQTGASCETVTPHGIAVMSQRVREYGATFIHSVKTRSAMETIVRLHHERINAA
tara:strand:- start:14005 stop:14730 length:726 start_codon:yes stop_codon:yes gene_type:complete